MKATLATIAALISAVFAQAEESKPVVLRHWGGDEYKDYFDLHREEAEKLPRWNPQTDVAAPITMSQVISEALPLIREAAEGWPWRITTIHLANAQGDAKDIWFYEVNATIDAQVDSQRKPVRFHLLKLMDGTILFPEIEVPEHSGPPAPDPVVRPEEAFSTADKIVLNRIGLQSGEDYVYEISKQVASGLPDWYAESGKPVPLETKDILSELHKLTQEQIPGQEWNLQSYRLMCGGKGGGKPSEARHISYYSIALLHRPKGSEQQRKYWNILILLDGSAVFPDPLTFSN